jgi:cytochrome b561
MKYDPLTRILHALVAGGIVAAMVTSLVMVHPKPGRPPNQWYEVHETVGMALLAVVTLYWLWIVVRTARRGGAMMLFPWLSRRRLAELGADAGETFRQILRLRLPGGTEPRPLPAAVQGLGMLLALALAGTGTAIDLMMAPDGGLPPVAHALKEVHEGLGAAMWGYLAIHPLIGLLHQLAGHRSLSRMFGAG